MGDSVRSEVKVMSEEKEPKRPRDGFIVCYECDGGGKCLICRGSGRIKNDTARCDYCLGRGTCILCDGAGEIPEEPYRQ